MTRMNPASRSGRIRVPFSSLAQLQRNTSVLLVAVTILVAAAILAGQDKPTAAPKSPQLTEIQKLTLQTLTQRIEIAQLKAQAAQQEFEAARTAFVLFVKPLTVEGYDLNLQTGEYVKKPPGKADGH